MNRPVDRDLVERTKALLEPGEISLVGAIVHTDFESHEEPAMLDAVVEIGDLIAEHAGHAPDGWYVYSGTNDPEFASNQHQGLTLADDEFVWECQTLLREGTFDVVIYYPAEVDQAALLSDIRELGHAVTGVEP